jgi:hypothetical protein
MDYTTNLCVRRNLRTPTHVVIIAPSEPAGISSRTCEYPVLAKEDS